MPFILTYFYKPLPSVSDSVPIFHHQKLQTAEMPMTYGERLKWLRKQTIFLHQ